MFIERSLFGPDHPLDLKSTIQSGLLTALLGPLEYREAVDFKITVRICRRSSSLNCRQRLIRTKTAGAPCGENRGGRRLIGVEGQLPILKRIVIPWRCGMCLVTEGGGRGS